jgi:hypothetical protein
MTSSPSSDDPDGGGPPSSRRRQSTRTEILGELRGEITIFQPLSIREISAGGVGIETAFSLQLDSLHDLRLSLGEQSVVLKGRVAHCSVADVNQDLVTYRSGIEFIEPPERVQQVIADFLRAIRSGFTSP